MNFLRRIIVGRRLLEELCPDNSIIFEGALHVPESCEKQSVVMVNWKHRRSKIR